MFRQIILSHAIRSWYTLKLISNQDFIILYFNDSPLCIVCILSSPCCTMCEVVSQPQIYCECNVQGVARHWRNPVRTRLTPLDSSDTLYIVFFAYTVKPMDNIVRFRHSCVGPVRFTHAPIVSLTCAFYPRT